MILLFDNLSVFVSFVTGEEICDKLTASLKIWEWKIF